MKTILDRFFKNGNYNQDIKFDEVYTNPPKNGWIKFDKTEHSDFKAYVDMFKSINKYLCKQQASNLDKDNLTRSILIPLRAHAYSISKTYYYLTCAYIKGEKGKIYLNELFVKFMKEDGQPLLKQFNDKFEELSNKLKQYNIEELPQNTPSIPSQLIDILKKNLL